MEKLEAYCNEMRSPRSAAEEQLDEVEAKVLEVEERNRQLAEQRNEPLIKKMNRCFCDFMIWQIQTQKSLKLRDLEL